MNVIFVGLSSVSLLLRFSPIPLLTHIPLWPPGCRGVEEDRYVRSLSGNLVVRAKKLSVYSLSCHHCAPPLEIKSAGLS